jgi:hypothetical protein
VASLFVFREFPDRYPRSCRPPTFLPRFTFDLIFVYFFFPLAAVMKLAVLVSVPHILQHSTSDVRFICYGHKTKPAAGTTNIAV